MSLTKMIRLSDGHSIPALAFGTGTAWFNRSGSTTVDPNVVQAVSLALKTGVRHLDTAETYNNEISTGVAIAQSGIRREDLYITTKILKGMGEVEKTLRRQLVELQVKYVDLYLIHSPSFAGTGGENKEILRKGWAELRRMKELGLTRSIGVSNFSLSNLQAICEDGGVGPVVNQIEFNPYIAAIPFTPPLLSYMLSHKIKIMSYGPSTAITEFSNLEKYKETKLYDVLLALEKENSLPGVEGLNSSQIALAYAHRPSLMGREEQLVVTTSSKESRISEALAVFQDGKLDEQAYEAIDSTAQSSATWVNEDGQVRYKRKFGGIASHMDM